MSKLLDNWEKRIEKNAFKSTLSYIDRKGKSHTEEVVFKRSLLPLGDWARIYPPVNDNGKVNWANLIFGGWRNGTKLLIILLIIAMVIFQFVENFNYIHYLETICKTILLP